MHTEPAPTHANEALEVAAAFGGIAELRAATGYPFSTVYSWTKSGRIPAWRRSAIVEAAGRKNITLPAAFLKQALPHEQAA